MTSTLEIYLVYTEHIRFSHCRLGECVRNYDYESFDC